MSATEITNLVIAIILVLISLTTQLFGRRGFAHDIYRWYNSRPDVRWGPQWFRWRLRPTEEQALVIAQVVVGIGFAFGTLFILAGLGVDPSGRFNR